MAKLWSSSRFFSLHILAIKLNSSNWPYDEKARLKGENLYEDKSTVKIVKVDPSEVITPERVAEIHRECLEKIEAQKPEKYWTLEVIQKQLEGAASR